MANEITLNAALSIFKPSIMGSAIGRSVAGALQTMNGNFTIESTILVGITPTAIPLGQVTQPHASWFHNCDGANYVTLFNGVSGAVLCRLLPGEAYPLPLDPTCVPYAQANTAAVLLEYLIAQL